MCCKVWTADALKTLILLGMNDVASLDSEEYDFEARGSDERCFLPEMSSA